MKTIKAVGGSTINLARSFPCLLLALLLTVCVPGAAKAVTMMDVGGMPLTIMGYATQSIGYGLSGEKYFDAKHGFQSAHYDVLLEAGLRVNSDLRFFTSGMLSGDWAYDILSGDGEWKRKEFNQSRNRLSKNTQLRDILKEAHLTWTTPNYFLRAGKQIVVWGETDGFRIMDQINPQDQRRGITDVEFESTILPIWLLQMQYFFHPQSTWLQDLGLEFIFNPNADFEKDRAIIPGNNVAGIWAPNVVLAPGPPEVRLGSINYNIREPSTWKSEGFEYGLRLRSLVNDAIVTLNYFYGRDNSPILKNSPVPPDFRFWDNKLFVHPYMEGYHPLFRLLGATFTRDFENLTVSGLGGVAPVLRLEGFYGFNNTFVNDQKNEFEQHDEIRWAVGVDWKIKINWLNPRAYFMVSPQFYHRHIVDYPDSGQTLTATGLTAVKKNNYQTSLFLSTSYLHNTIEPSLFWLADYTYGHSGFLRPQLKYIYSHNKLDFTLGAIFLYGNKEGFGLEPLSNKDHAYFTVSYRF